MKPGSASEKEYLLNQLNAIEKTLKKQFGETYKQAINIGEIRNVINSGDSFSFSNNPSAKKKVDSMLKTLQGNLTNTVSQYSQTIGRVATQTAKDGVKASVSPSKKEQDFVDKLSDDAMKDARKSASVSAGEAKMSSSVWNFGDYSKKEIQAIINAGIRKGLTVQGIADSVTPYLNNPLLEDAEPEFQKIQTPKGVYKSAYKNALRLARTEVMRAYDEAEWNSYQNDPMVVGFEVKTSNNHTVLIHGKRVPLKDMCDQLAGKYPKSFKFTGWHPQCRCTMLPITIAPDELGDLMEAQENGEEFVSKNTVTELPEGFKEWIENNAERFDGLPNSKLPSFIQENGGIESLINAKRADKGDENEVNKEEDKDGETKTILERLKQSGITSVEVKKFPNGEIPSDEDIIERVGGFPGSKDASGSCVSLALTYIANKMGYDVLDYRGGASTNFFQHLESGLETMFGGKVYADFSKLIPAKDLTKVRLEALNSIKEGEIALLQMQEHGAIVRHTEKGYAYLELQGRNTEQAKAKGLEGSENGWKSFRMIKTLATRFGDGATMGGVVCPICVTKLSDFIKKEDEFKEIISYLNTLEKDSKKYKPKQESS